MTLQSTEGRPTAVAQPSRDPVLPVIVSIVGLLLLSVAAGLALAGTDRVVAPLSIPAALLLLLFAVVEMYVLHVQVRREARTISMSEIPLVLGMFFVPPVTVMIVRVLGSGLVYALYRRQAPLKLAFNVALNGAETGLALLVFRAIQHGSPAVGARSWAAAYAGACVANAFAGLAVTFVIYLYEGSLRWTMVRQSVSSGVPVAVLTATAGLIASSCLILDVGTVWLLGLAAVIVVLSYRAYASLSERHLSLERLYRFSQVVASSPEIDGVMRSVLSQARDLLQAEVAELMFLPTEGTGLRVTWSGSGRLVREEAELGPQDWLWRQVVELGAPVLLERGNRNADVRRHLARRGLREAIVAPLRGESGVVGLLTVADRMGSVRSFDPDDVRLLETVANHASVALEHGRLMDRLRHQAMHDTLTGLANRSALESGTEQALADVRTGASPGLALLLMDLDGFKEVNDTLGHLHGDLLLREVGARLLGAVPDGTLVARLGGDEFAVMVPGIDGPVQALALAGLLLKSLEEPASLEDVRLEVRGSIGVSISPADGTEMGTLLKCADVAMYAAKASGLGVQAYSRELDANDPSRLMLATKLREALANDELLVHGQPQALFATGEVVGVELLVRWQHPDLGLLLPDEFIPVAERTGLLRAVTACVLGEGVAACARWLAEGRRLSVSVNLSARSLLDPDLVADVAALLDLHDVPPELLVLEITENGIITDLAGTTDVLLALRGLGVRLSVDDFGTGYSSLSYLSRLPVNEVKVDKHFVTRMRHDVQDAAIVRSVIDLGHNLGLAVVAEGVEDAATWDALAALGCDLAQGYHLSAAMPLDLLPGWVDARAASRLVLVGDIPA